MAADRGNSAVVASLLGAGERIDRQDWDGQTALHIAVARGHTELVERLLDAGASWRIARNDGLTPLQLAVLGADPESTSRLLARLRGAHPLTADGRDLLMLGSHNADMKVARLLLANGASVQRRDAGGRTTLIHAVQQGNAELVELLLEAGADPDARDAEGRTALWYAADDDIVRTVNVLLAEGAAAESADEQGDTPIHRAAMHGHADSLRAFERVGQLAESANAVGMTPLMLAAVNGHLGVVERLVRLGHDVDARNAKGNSALLICAQRGDVTAVRKLVHLGADPALVNQSRMNATDLARMLGQEQVLAGTRRLNAARRPARCMAGTLRLAACDASHRRACGLGTMVGGLGLQFHGSNPRTGMRSSDRHQPGRRTVIRALTGRRGGRAQLRVAVWVGLAALALAGCVSEEDLLSDSQSPPIDDDDPPPGDLSMLAPDDVSGEATGIATDVELGDPDASGGDGQYTFGNDAPAGGFALGNSVVTWTVTDGNGATATDAQQVVLVDTTAPFIEDPADLQTVASGALTPVTLAVPAVSDAVDASPVVVNDQPAGGFPLGTTEVTWMATDASGNSATVLQYVTIVDGDPGGPLTLAVPADRNLEATGATTAVELGSATASGGMPPLSITNDAPAGGYPLGTTTVTWTVTDMGAMSVTDTQIVLVADTTAPALTVPGAITQTQSSSGGLTAVDLGTATASDLVDPSPTLVNDAPGGFPLGATTVTWTASDASGNSRSATQQVTIVAFAPESCESLVEVFADEIYPLLDRADPLTCNGCHTGSAPLATPNGFAFPNSPPGTEDFDVFRAVAMLDAGGQSLVLVKARGGATHTGGDRFPAGNGDPDFLALADFVNRARGCEEEPTGGTEKVELGTPYEQLHRIAGVLASRPPTADEIATSWPPPTRRRCCRCSTRSSTECWTRTLSTSAWSRCTTTCCSRTSMRTRPAMSARTSRSIPSRHAITTKPTTAARRGMPCGAIRTTGSRVRRSNSFATSCATIVRSRRSSRPTTRW